jgi:hypothetical protein
VFLVLLAIWELLLNCVTLGSLILLGKIDVLIAAIVGVIIFWLLFYFIWIGVHWVRWISGGFLCLVAFANLIWGIRDGDILRLIDASIGLPMGAYLALAPSVYFFALRQKERVRWKESLVIAAVFALLLVSAGATMIGLYRHKSHLEEQGQLFADRAFRRIFAENDNDFLVSHVTQRLVEEEGSERISWFMADRHARIGEARNIRRSKGKLQFWYRFPATLVPHGRMTTYAESDYGPVQLQVAIIRAGGDWQIDGIWSRYLHAATLPPE